MKNVLLQVHIDEHIQVLQEKMDASRFPSFARHHPALAISLSWAAIIIAIWMMKENARAAKYRLPPRVPGIPIFGNTFQLPPLKQGLWGVETAKKYGEMLVWAHRGQLQALT